tara:strand:+ start:125 stop:922 length:798 start_codon:yes stop_codon:yes gene_type:complete
MAITRAQIPEQVDLFDAGGGVGDIPSSLKPEDIIALYGAVQSAPVSTQDIETQAAQMAGLFPQPKKQNFFDLASEVGAGLVAGASSPGGFGVGLTAGLKSFNEKAKKIQAEKDKIRQETALLAYQQVEAKRAEQLATSKEILEMQFEAALEGQGGMFPGTTNEAAALNYILRAEEDPRLKDTPEYKIALAVAGKTRMVAQRTETGTIMVEQPGIDILAILGPRADAPESEIQIGNTTWTFTGRRDGNNQPIYSDGTKEQVIKAGP